MSATNVSRPARSAAIDLLRGVAVLMVMCAHLPFSYTRGPEKLTFPPTPIGDIMAEGHWGVQLFLVISGYCIHIRWARKADLDTRVEFWAFWKRRLLRLYPPYAVMVVASAAAMYVMTRPPLTGLAIDVLVLLLLVQNVTDASQRVGNGPFWSLALEEQLYLLYFPLLELRRRFGWAAALGVPFVVSFAWVAAFDHHLVPEVLAGAWPRVGPAYWFAWTLGALAAESHLDVIKTPWWTKQWWLFVILFPVGVIWKFPFHEIVATCSFFFLIHATVSAEKLRPLGRWTSPMVRLGEISYGVYLVHNVAFVAAKRALVFAGLPNGVVFVLRFLAGLGAGYVVYRTLEKPFMLRAQKIAVPLVKSTRGTASPEPG